MPYVLVVNTDGELIVFPNGRANVWNTDFGNAESQPPSMICCPCTICDGTDSIGTVLRLDLDLQTGGSCPRDIHIFGVATWTHINGPPIGTGVTYTGLIVIDVEGEIYEDVGLLASTCGEVDDEPVLFVTLTFLAPISLVVTLTFNSERTLIDATTGECDDLTVSATLS